MLNNEGVVKGGECKPPSVCGTNSFCCPDAKHCVEVVEATGMKFCASNCGLDLVCLFCVCQQDWDVGCARLRVMQHL